MSENLNWNEFLASTMQPTENLKSGSVAELESLSDGSKGTIFGTGISGLDEYMAFAPGQLYILAGRSGVGKSALAGQMMASVLKDLKARGLDGYVGFFSAEMTATQVFVREACRDLNLDSRKILARNGTSRDRELAAQYIKDTDWSQWLIDQSPAPTVQHMLEQIDVWNERGPMRFIMFDYVQLAGEVGRNEALRLSEVLNLLKGLAKKFNCPVLAIHQFTRDIERRGNKNPMMADLAWGGEQAGDSIMGLVPRTDENGEAYANQFQLHIVKNRFGDNNVFVPLIRETPSLRFRSAKYERVDLNETYGEVLS